MRVNMDEVQKVFFFVLEVRQRERVAIFFVFRWYVLPTSSVVCHYSSWYIDSFPRNQNSNILFLPV